MGVVVLQIALVLIFPQAIEFHRGIWILLVGSLTIFLFRTFWRLRAMIQIAPVAEKLGAQPSDLFLTAWELSGETPDEFQTRAMRYANKAFPKEWVKQLAPARWRLFTGLFALGLIFFILGIGKVPGPLRSRALWPFRPVPSSILSVQPGNAFFPRGEDVAVTVRVSTHDFTEPRLEVLSAGGAWESRSLFSDSPGVYTTILRSLQEPLDYRAFNKTGRSPRFRLTPFDPPKLLHLQAEIRPPAYARQKPNVVQDVLSLRVLTGSRVRWSLVLDPADSLLRMDADQTPPTLAKTGVEWSWTETPNGKLVRRLWARRSDGSGDVLLTELTMEAVPDEPPQVSLLSPNEDLQADKKDQIPMTAELTDDVGLWDVGLAFRINEGSWTREGWKRYPLGTLHNVLDHGFDLTRLSLKGGDRVDFFISARDGRNPPGEGRSETRHMEIIDTTAIHDQVRQDLEAFQKSLLDRLAEERSVRDHVAVSTPNWGGALTEQRQTARRLMNDENQFKILLAQMAQDPGTDRETLMDHQNLAESLRDLNQSALPEADRSLVQQDPSRAARAMDPIINELERISRLSAEAVRAQDTRQLLRDQAEVSNVAENVAHALAEKPSMTEEEARQFQETVQAMREAMDRILERVKQLQKNESEEFLKNARVETLRFDQVSQALNRLNQALQHQNGTDALAAAQEVLDQLKEMERQLNRAGEGLSSSNAETETVLTEKLDDVKKIIRRQEVLLDRTSGLSEILQSRDLTLGEQANIPPWAEEQNGLARDARSSSEKLTDIARGTPIISPKIAPQISAAADAMEGAARFLKSLDLRGAQDQQEKALELLRDAQEKLSESLKTLQSLSQSAGAGGRSTIRRLGRGMSLGGSGDVPLPRANDFRPPSEFRQEILDSMKESYPEDQEGPVQNYYRHWTK